MNESTTQTCVSIMSTSKDASVDSLFECNAIRTPTLQEHEEERLLPESSENNVDVYTNENADMAHFMKQVLFYFVYKSSMD